MYELARIRDCDLKVSGGHSVLKGDDPELVIREDIIEPGFERPVEAPVASPSAVLNLQNAGESRRGGCHVITLIVVVAAAASQSRLRRCASSLA